MKINEIKHNHSLTDLLKVIIFSLLMFAPLLSIATRCLYVICNKNAYQSAEITQTTYDRHLKYQTNEVNSYDDLIEGNVYTISTEYYLPSDIFSYIDLRFYLPKSFEFTFSYTDDVVFNENDKLSIGNSNMYKMYNDLLLCYFIEDDSNQDSYIAFEGSFDNNIDIIYKSLSFELTQDTSFSDFFAICENEYYEYQEVEATTLDNVFEYSVNKLEDNQLFNWTKNTAIYTGVNAMTTQLEIEGAVIPILITYWFLLTIIYVIIDIVLKLFTILTHLIGSKTT